jgi:hypothetical protein
MRRPFDISSESTRLDDLAPSTLRFSGGVAAVGIGGAVIAAFFSQGGFDRLLQTYLVSFAFILSLALGGLFFVLLQHVTRAGWSVVVRRVAEGMAGNVLLAALLAIPVVLGMSRLYHWMHPHGDPLLEAKTGYLNPVFFVVRLVVYFAVWGLLARTFHRRSTEQDSSGDPALTVGMERLSAPGIVLFALALNFAAFDLLMSLDPHWFSTIFGVYYFSGSVVGFLAVAPVALVALQRAGRLRHAVSVEHYHDLGKLLFAFIVFWAYIAFSQYMLIWYGNLPEETGWFLKRQSGGWAWVSLALLFGHFVIPFLALLSRFVKRRPMLLAGAGVWMLAMHWLDLYWLVMPEFSPDAVLLGPVDVLCLVGLLGLFAGSTVLWLRRHPLLPERDPRLSESLAFENV